MRDAFEAGTDRASRSATAESTADNHHSHSSSVFKRLEHLKRRLGGDEKSGQQPVTIDDYKRKQRSIRVREDRNGMPDDTTLAAAVLLLDDMDAGVKLKHTDIGTEYPDSVIVAGVRLELYDIGTEYPDSVMDAGVKLKHTDDFLPGDSPLDSVFGKGYPSVGAGYSKYGGPLSGSGGGPLSSSGGSWENPFSNNYTTTYGKANTHDTTSSSSEIDSIGDVFDFLGF